METKDIGGALSEWVPITNLGHLAALGKLMEEVNELGAIIARIIIQGIDGQDPETGKPNITALEEEIADVRGISLLVINRFNLSESYIADRAERKHKWKLGWIRFLDTP